MDTQFKIDRFGQRDWLWVGLFFIAVWVGMFWTSGLYHGGFNYFLDDHLLVSIYAKLTSWKATLIDPFSTLFQAGHDRFRPMYFVFLHIFTKLYGLNPFIWYLSSSLIAVITSLVFYAFARRINFSMLNSLIFTLLIMMGYQASTYARFGTPETTATLLLGLAFLFSTGKYRLNSSKITTTILVILFAALAALNKEACILMLPALAVFKLWNSIRDKNNNLVTAWKESKAIVVGLLVLFVVLVVYIKVMAISGPGYAGISKETFALHNIIKVIKSMVRKTSFGMAIIANGYLWWHLMRSKKRISADLIGFYITCILIIVPQWIIYSKSGFQDHYFFPIIIGIALLTVYPLHLIRQINKWLFNTMIILLALFVGIQAQWTFGYFKRVANETVQQKMMIKDIAKNVDQKGKIIIFGNPYVHNEKLFGFKTIFSDILKRKNVYLATLSSKDKQFKTFSLAKEELPWLYLGRAPLVERYNHQTIDALKADDLSDVEAIIVLSPRELRQDVLSNINQWFNSAQYFYKDYPENDVGIYFKKSSPN